MPIFSGRRLGPYEILFGIGAGGMGEVYRARDTRLDRIVAIKVLPAHLVDRSESRERFEREARTIASLNHPHICTLHDIGHQDGIDFFVMEYLAHRKDITHRDLRPGNIMLTKSGAKLLDFGLAKLWKETAPANIFLSKLSTEDDVTAQEMILGTIQYMAPEQLEAKQGEMIWCDYPSD
jgi:serine/threonine protein kinase